MPELFWFLGGEDGKFYVAPGGNFRECRHENRHWQTNLFKNSFKENNFVKKSMKII